MKTMRTYIDRLLEQEVSEPKMVATTLRLTDSQMKFVDATAETLKVTRQALLYAIVLDGIEAVKKANLVGGAK